MSAGSVETCRSSFEGLHDDLGCCFTLRLMIEQQQQQQHRANVRDFNILTAGNCAVPEMFFFYPFVHLWLT